MPETKDPLDLLGGMLDKALKDSPLGLLFGGLAKIIDGAGDLAEIRRPEPVKPEAVEPEPAVATLTPFTKPTPAPSPAPKGRILIDGVAFPIVGEGNIVIHGNTVIMDGQTVVVDTSGAPVEIKVEGTVKNVVSTANLSVNRIDGNASVSGDASVGAIGGNVTVRGDLSSSNIGGNAVVSGDATVNNVSGSITVSGDMKINSR